MNIKTIKIATCILTVTLLGMLALIFDMPVKDFSDVIIRGVLILATVIGIAKGVNSIIQP